MLSFNLVDERWIPCVILKDNSRLEFGLKDVLLKAHEIREIDDPSPLVTVAISRLLIAILHHNFGPSSTKEWQTLWDKGQWDAQKLSAYFDQRRNRFDLFDGSHPFYQASDLDFKYETPSSKFTHALACGNNPTLFDHTCDSPPKALTPAEAARYLVAYQAFAVGGLVSRLPGEGPSAKGAPLVKGAVALIRGQNLFRTLMLNLHPYSSTDEEPFPFDSKKDRPAWESNQQTKPVDRHPAGPLDLLTWQSRQIRLHPEVDSGGRTTVKYAVIMRGNQFPDRFSLHGKETMLAFQKNPRAKGTQDPWPPVTFQEERALWRDSLALFESVKEQRSRPKTLTWLHDLAANGVLERRLLLEVDYFGLSADRAKILLWRHERLPLPLAYLDDKDLLDKLKEALDMAEQVGKLFLAGFDKVGAGSEAKPIPRPFQILASTLLSTPQGRPPDQDSIKNMIKGLAPGRAYWPRLEAPFKKLLVELADDRAEEAAGVTYGLKTLPGWAATLRGCAETAFKDTTRGLGTSARALKAVVQAERRFRYDLSQKLERYATRKGVTNDTTH